MIEASILTKLLAAAGVTALVGQRIYYIGRIPEDVTLPFVTLQMIEDIPVHSHGGYSGMRKARIQINSFDDSYTGAHSLAEAIFDALDSYVGTVGDHYIGRCHQDITGDFLGEDNLDVQGVHTDYVIDYN